MGRAFWQEKKEPNEIPWLEIRQVHELTEEFELYRKKNGRKRKTKSQNTKHISQKKKKTLMIF